MSTLSETRCVGEVIDQKRRGSTICPRSRDRRVTVGRVLKRERELCHTSSTSLCLFLPPLSLSRFHLPFSFIAYSRATLIMSRASEENTPPVPASPKTKKASERRALAPVTPQRINRLPKQTRTPSTPLTPSYSSIVSSPFTPITNVYSSASSVASPNSSASTKVDFSPDIVKSKAKSLAESTNNWRTRAKENGIKVASENAKGV